MSNFTIQDIFLKYGEKYVDKHKLSKEQWKVFNAIINCGTKNLGYHICTCDECGEEYFGYNSCRNRHCPMCQGYAREKWIQKESSYLLDWFIRRFLLHVLPDNFIKIKHSGLLSNRNKKKNIKLSRLLISRILTNEFVSTISRKFHEFKCEKCSSTNFSYSFQYDIHRLSI